MRFLLLLSLVLSLPSCRKLRALVYEERRPCPAWVTLTAGREVDGDTWPYVQLYLSHGGGEPFTEERKLRTDEFNAGQTVVWEKDSPFAALALAGWSGIIKDGLVLVPQGRECPGAVGGDVEGVLSAEERYDFPLPMRALSIPLLFSFSGDIPAGSELVPEVTGNMDGYTVPGFRLHKGPFACHAHREGKDRMAARIPRQEDREGLSGVSALTVSFLYRENSSAPWVRLSAVSLGSVLGANRYDWTRDEPEPVRIGVTRAGARVGKVEVSSGNWTTAIYTR